MKKKAGTSRRNQSQNAIGQTGHSDFRRHVGRRKVVMALGGVTAAAAGAIVFAGLFGSDRATAEEITVYKSPSCGCCGNWAMHLRQNGFDVSIKNIEDVDPVKKQAGIPNDLESCHTAFVAGYVVEGHVPAENIRKILAERPKIKGLAVPGMPSSAPGMDGPDPEPYTVYSFDADGKAKVYASY